MSGELKRLPVNLALGAGEALDGYLERVADANHLSGATFLRLVGDQAASRFLLLAPSRGTLKRLASVTGLTEESITAATLASFDGRSIDLDGFYPRNSHSYRQVAARGWAAIHGSQLCPQCLATDGIWQLRWRSPYSAICVVHETYLLTECPGCRRPFRDNRHSPLRAVGPSIECGNPLGAGPRKHCRTNLAQLRVRRASPDQVATQKRVDSALAGADIQSLGGQLCANAYLRELRALTVLLCHLANQRTDHIEPAWVIATQEAGAERTADRGPRWGIRPPDDSVARAGAYAVADRILAARDLDAAAEELTPWLDRVPVVPEGVLGWLADRTQATETLSGLIIRAHAPHRRLSHLLNEIDELLPAAFVPQVIPDDLYQRHLRGLFDSTSGTVRSFAAICLARSNDLARSWAEAGSLLGLRPGTAERTARACSARALVKPQRVIEALDAVARDLPPIDRREVETLVVALRRRRTWFETFAATRNGTRASSKSYALTWIWLNIAGGDVANSPGWRIPPTRHQRALYRQFANSLGGRHQNHLGAVVGPAIGAAEAFTAMVTWRE